MNISYVLNKKNVSKIVKNIKYKLQILQKTDKYLSTCKNSIYFIELFIILQSREKKEDTHFGRHYQTRNLV